MGGLNANSIFKFKGIYDTNTIIKLNEEKNICIINYSKLVWFWSIGRLIHHWYDHISSHFETNNLCEGNKLTTSSKIDDE